MKAEFVDFKTVSLQSKLDTSMGAELSLTQEGRMTAKAPDDWNGFAFFYLNVKIHDPEDRYFVFDIVTETVVKLPDEVKELNDEAMEAGLSAAQEKTFEAIRSISVGMGINEIDLSSKE